MATHYYMVRSQGGGAKVLSNVIGRYTLGWLEKREFPKIDFRHVDPGVYVFGGLKKVVKKKLG